MRNTPKLLHHEKTQVRKHKSFVYKPLLTCSGPGTCTGLLSATWNWDTRPITSCSWSSSSRGVPAGAVYGWKRKSVVEVLGRTNLHAQQHGYPHSTVRGAVSAFEVSQSVRDIDFGTNGWYAADLEPLRGPELLARGLPAGNCADGVGRQLDLFKCVTLRSCKPCHSGWQHEGHIHSTHGTQSSTLPQGDPVPHKGCLQK